jgi:exodeoxyribonuclease-3
MTIGSDKYQYKLSWLKQLHDYISTQQCYYSQLIVLGDFNIAPTDKDLYNPKAWEGNILVSPAERNAFQALINLGLYDTFRQFEQPPASFSWWDYRADAFQRNHGVRIDFILASQTLINTCTSCLIDTQPRNSERPSDHAPVLATFNI